jgi:plastocyanin
MKKQVLFIIASLSVSVASATTVTIGNSGFTFTPDSVSIHVGDTIRFQVGSTHKPIEVSQSTWNANSASPITGFSLPNGGGIVAGLTAGIHYYVCQPHAGMGMKGRIFVTPVTGLANVAAASPQLNIYPNPSNGKFNVHYQSASNSSVEVALDVFNILGDKVYSSTDVKGQVVSQIDLSTVPAGIYFVKIYDREKVLVKRVIIQ